MTAQTFHILRTKRYTLARVLKILSHYMWHKQTRTLRSRLVYAFLFLVLSKVFAVTVPFCFKYVVDALNATTPFQVITWTLLGYGAARLCAQMCSEFKDMIFARVTYRIARIASLEVFQYLHKLSLKFHLDRKTGELTRTLERGKTGIESVFHYLVFNIVPTMFEIIFILGAVWWLYDSILAWIIATTFGVYVFYTLGISEWRTSFIRTMNKQDNKIHAQAIDSLLNYETVKYFGSEKHEGYKLDSILEKYENYAVQTRFSLALLNIGQTMIIGAGLIILLYVGLKRFQLGLITAGDFVLLNQSMLQLAVPLNILGMAYREVKGGILNIDDMIRLLGETCDIPCNEDAPALQHQGGEVVFDHVEFRYQQEKPLLKNISFHIRPGHTLGIVGASGVGKSTLLRLFFRFYDVTKGAIYIDGQDIREISQESLRQAIGIVPQDTVLFNDTIRYNIAYGNPQATEEEILEAAKQANIHQTIIKWPKGYDTLVGERGLKLSGGEKQRVAIARCLLKKPLIFIFDEATSALDSQTERQIHRNIQSISEHHTTVIIAHRLSTVVEADHILVLSEGCVAEQGTHQDLLDQQGIYARMWNIQLQSH